MASQTVKLIDITKTYLPVDPVTFPETRQTITKEEAPAEQREARPYEGYNFMPTSYGYKSFFGVNSLLDIDALTSRVDYIFVLQTNTFQNIAVALCEDGIWTKDASVLGVWVHAITLPIPAVGAHKEWSYTLIGNDLFCYRAGDPSYYRWSDNETTVSPGQIEGALPTILSPSAINPAYTFFAVTPNFLNMAGQEGLFKAGSRLGFWDIANSTAWSSIDDFADFTPSVTTLAGSSIFIEISGRITNIFSMGDGFIIYATKSITNIRRDDTNTFQWNPLPLLRDAGIAFRREACLGDSQENQFAYTNIGLIKITREKAETIVPEISDFLKETNEPVYLSLLEKRYLCLQPLDSTYINSSVSFYTEAIPASIAYYPPNTAPEYTAEVNDILTGGTDTQAILDAYIAANGLPSRGIGGYSPVIYGTLHDKSVLKKLADGLPTIGTFKYSKAELDALVAKPPIVDFNVVVSYGTGLEAVGVPMASHLTSYAIPEAWYPFYPTLVNPGMYTVGRPLTYLEQPILIGQNPPYETGTRDYVYQKWTGTYVFGGTHAPITDYYPIEVFSIVPNILDGINNTRAYTAPELALGLGGIIALQKEKWATNDAATIATITYVGLYTEAKVVAIDVATPDFSLFPVDYGATVMNDSSNTHEYSYLSNIHNFPSEDRMARDAATEWGEAIVYFDGVYGTVFIEREQTVNTTIRYSISYSAGADLNSSTISYSKRLGGGGGDPIIPEFTKTFSYKPVTATGDIYAVSYRYVDGDGYTRLIQQGNIIISGYNYTDSNGLSRYIPYSAGLGIPSIPSFIPGTITIPPTSFLLQNGSIGPLYPTHAGALVYDLELKKWGKMKQDYKLLVDWSPINNLSSSIIPYSTFGLQGGCLLPTGKIAIFDERPIDSYIKYGKIGYYRQGFTKAEEVRIAFRDSSNCIIRTEASLDGHSVEGGLSKSFTLAGVTSAVVYPSTSARWHTISVVGTYDIKHLEFRGTLVGNR